jgi:hypothetical protein
VYRFGRRIFRTSKLRKTEADKRGALGKYSEATKSMGAHICKPNIKGFAVVCGQMIARVCRASCPI